MSDTRSLPEKVRSWIEKTGLPLELEALAELRGAGFDAEHSSVYSDPELDKGREIDVVAHARDPLGLLYMATVVECKASPNPWVVLTNRDDPKVGKMASFGIFESRAEKLLPEGFLYRGETAYLLKSSYTGGYALRQAFGNESDPAYAASMSVLKASVAVVRNYTVSRPRFIFALPVLVVDAPIFECSRSADGELELRAVEYSEFVFTAHIPERTRAIVRLVHRRSLRRFSTRLWRLSCVLKDELKPSMDQLLKSIQSGDAT